MIEQGSTQGLDELLRAVELVTAAGGHGDNITALVIPGEPIAKARARVNRHRHYTPQRTLDAEADIAREIQARRMPRQAGNVAVAAIFYRSNRHRIDTDNLMKTVLDGITKAGTVWKDDSQVTALLAVTEYDPDNPRTVVAIASHESTLTRGDDSFTHTCETCGKGYRPHKGAASKSRFCSKACRTTRPARSICEKCGGPTSVPKVKICRRCYNAERAAA